MSKSTRTLTEHPRVEASKMVREISIEVIAYGIIAAILAYLVGAGLAWLFGWPRQ